MMKRLILMAALVVGASAGASTKAIAAAPRLAQQCWYWVDTSAPNSCDFCEEECFGSGYICCF